MDALWDVAFLMGKSKSPLPLNGKREKCSAKTVIGNGFFVVVVGVLVGVPAVVDFGGVAVVVNAQFSMRSVKTRPTHS